MAQPPENTEVFIFFFFVTFTNDCSSSYWNMGIFWNPERLNKIETNYTRMSSDVEMNTEFYPKWSPIGPLPADSEQFMLIEQSAGELEKLNNRNRNGQAPPDAIKDAPIMKGVTASLESK